MNPDYEFMLISLIFTSVGAYSMYVSRVDTDNHFNNLYRQYLGGKGKIMFYAGIILLILSAIGPRK